MAIKQKCHQHFLLFVSRECDMEKKVDTAVSGLRFRVVSGKGSGGKKKLPLGA